METKITQTRVAYAAFSERKPETPIPSTIEFSPLSSNSCFT